MTQVPEPAPQPAFEQLALQQGLITQEQLDECAALQKKVSEAGLETSLEEILLKKGYLTRQKAAGINAALGKGGKATIEGYHVLEKIAQGGMGAVYKAKQTSLDRFVAIKVLLPRFAKERDAVERFLREAKAIARLNHPNIVAGIDAGYSNGIYYYVMEYLDGEALEKSLRKRGPMHWSEALPVARAVASALDHAHQNGVIHRDIKPGNIILMRDGGVKVADLGLARIATGDNIYVTQTGVILGTPAYISPEMARGEKIIDIRSDIYSLGITLFEMLTGQVPYQSDNSLVVVTKHATADVPVHRVAERNVPAGVVELVRKMTARDKRARYQSPAELLVDIEAVLRGDSPAAAPSRRPEPPPDPEPAAAPAPVVHYLPPVGRRRANPVIAIAVGAVTLVGAVALATLVLHSGGEKPPVPWPRPAPPPAPVVDAPPRSSREEAAQKLYAEAEKFEREKPDRIEDVLDGYEDILDRCRLTGFQAAVESKIDEYRTLLLNEISKRSEKLRRSVAENVLNTRHGHALRDIAAAEHVFRHEYWRNRIRELRRETEQKMQAFVEESFGKSDQHARRREYDAAIKAIAPIAGIGSDEEEQRAREKIAELERLKQEHESAAGQASRREQQLFKDTADDILALARRRDFATAARRADLAVDDLHTFEYKAEMQRYKSWMEAARRFVEQASEAMRRISPGEKLSVDVRAGARPERIEDRVHSVGYGTISLGFQRPRVVTTADLTAATLAALASRPADGGRTPPVDLRGVALLAIIGEEGESAVTYMERVTRAGYEVPQGVAQAYEEVAPRRLLVEADQLWQDGRKKEAGALYRKLRDDFGKSKPYLDNRERIDVRATP